MNKVLLIGFKGKNNASGMLVEQLSPEHKLLTNSFAGLKRDIDAISTDYESVLMFGVDKDLTSEARIEKCAAKDGEKMFSVMKAEEVAGALKQAGIKPYISANPTAYLCNEAYWHVLRKFSGRAIFIHIPTIKHIDESFINKMKLAFRLYSGS